MKKLFTVLVAVVMAVSCLSLFASCGGKNESVKLIDINLTNEEYAFAMKKGNTELKESFNAYLKEIKDNGTFDKIIDKYFKGIGEKEGFDVATTDVTNTKDNFVVATNCPFDPFEFLGDNGKIYGVDMEIASGYAKKHNLILVIKNIKFESIFTEIETDKVDIGMAGITVDEEREKLYDFSDKYYQASQKIIVLESNKDFDECKTKEDVENVLKSLNGKKVAFQKGTTGNWYVAGDEDWGYEGFSNVEAKGYDTAQLAVMDMINGNVYAVVVDEAPANALVKAFSK